MPRQRFIGQRLVDFLRSKGFQECPELDGPPAGLVVLSLDCLDSEERVVLVHHTVEQGAPYAEKILASLGISADEFWVYLA